MLGGLHFYTFNRGREALVGKNVDKNVLKALALAEELLRLADEGDAHRQDVGCGILYGVLRDAAYKIKSLAEGEIGEHKRNVPRPRQEHC